MCPSFHRTDMDPHAYAGEPPVMVAFTLDVSEPETYLKRAAEYADSDSIDDHRALAENLRELAIWANNFADVIDHEVTEAEG